MRRGQDECNPVSLLQSRYILFENSGDDRNSLLNRIDNCDLKTLSRKVVISTENGPKEFLFWQIRDLISSMYD